MDRFRELEMFVAVVDAGSFVGASKRLRTSKAAVSRVVRQLELRLGARLLNRTTRTLSLTEVGRAYHQRGARLLADLEEAEGSAQRSAVRAVGTLRVSAPLSFGVLALAKLWPRFLTAHPQVELDVTLSDSVVNLVEDGFDLAVRLAKLVDSTLVSRKLAGLKMVLCASPAYLRRRGRPKHLAELATHQTVAYAYWSTGDTWHLETPQGPQRVTVRPRMHVNNGETCVEAALAHQGIIFQPSFLVEPHLERGALVEVLPDCRGGDFAAYAVYPSRQQLSGKVRALVDFLARAFKA